MSTRLHIALLAPLPLDDVAARVELQSGASVLVPMRDGRYDGEVPGVATQLTLTLDPLPPTDAGSPPPATPAAPGGEAPDGPPVEVAHLFDHGVAIPADGRLVRALIWGTPCDQERAAPAAENTRFGSFEHMLCAEAVGLDAAGAPLGVDGGTAEFDHTTRFDVGGKPLRFGEIIALGGDYYAHLDAQAARELAFAWPERRGVTGLLTGDYRTTTLVDDDPAGPRAILEVVLRDRDKQQGLTGEAWQIVKDLPGAYPARRYLALACSNYCHFAAQPGDGVYVEDERNEALRLYRAYHARALAEAVAAASAINREPALHRALCCDAFGCHFLTDLFAGGHIRVPRRALGERFGVVKGSLRLSATMHEEDNRLGLWCTPRVGVPGEPRLVWRAFGDGALRSDEAKPHLALVREAVRRSVEELFTAFLRGAAPAFAPHQRAEALIPAPLASGTAPTAADRGPDGLPLPSGLPPNHFPLLRALHDGTIARRQGGPESPEYQPLG